MIHVTRTDETWHRLREWTTGQPSSERLAALVLDAEGYESIDPSHPLGGPDGGADALVKNDGKKWIMAVYFPRGQQTIAEITSKLFADIASAKKREEGLDGLVFVTNQELRWAERRELRLLGDGIEIDLIHLERMTTILDRPLMAQVREQFLDIEAGPRPILVSADVQGTARAFVRTDEVRDKLVEIHEQDVRERNEKNKRATDPNPLMPRISLAAMGYSEPDRTVLSTDEITANVSSFRELLTTRWHSCQDYLARIAWPAIHFTVTNCEKSFLTDVEVILTFHGARGLEYDDIDEFEWERLNDPSWEAPAGPFGMSAVSYMPKFTPKDHPVDWRHDESGDLEVTINLPRLRPHPPARQEYDDVVVIVDDPDRESITVTYTVTAHGYGTVFEGETFELPVERTDMFVSVQAALAAVTPADD